MRVKCILCQKIDQLDDENPLAKKLRNRPIHTYMCDECYKRIEEKTKTRIASGKFKLYRSNTEENEW